METKKPFRIVLASVAIIIGVIAFFYAQKYIASGETDELLCPYKKADSKIKKTVLESDVATLNISKEKLKVLQNQYQIIQFKKEHHLGIVTLMNSYYFAATLLLAILSIVLGVLILKTADNGIKSKSSLFRTIFYTVLCLTTFFGVLIQVLDHKENINVNKNIYLTYSSVQLKIYNYIVSDGKGLELEEKESPIQIEDFIVRINRDINAINTLVFGIEHDRIKSPEEILNYKKP